MRQTSPWLDICRLFPCRLRRAGGGRRRKSISGYFFLAFFLFFAAFFFFAGFFFAAFFLFFATFFFFAGFLFAAFFFFFATFFFFFATFFFAFFFAICLSPPSRRLAKMFFAKKTFLTFTLVAVVYASARKFFYRFFFVFHPRTFFEGQKYNYVDL